MKVVENLLNIVFILKNDFYMDENRKQIMEDLFKFSDKLGLGLTFSPSGATIKLDAGNMKSFLGLIGKVFDVDLDNSKYSKDYVEFLDEISKKADWKGRIDEDLKKLDDFTDEFWELFEKKFCNKVEKLASEKNLEKVDADKKESRLESVEPTPMSEKESGVAGECGLRVTCTDACSECDEKKILLMSMMIRLLSLIIQTLSDVISWNCTTLLLGL